MSSFEFIFTLFGLVLGLALAEVLGGFARAVKRHGAAKLGVLTPVISLFLIYEIIDFWLDAWNARELIPVGIGSLLVCVIIAGLYYFACVLVWPEDGDPAWDDLDSWALSNKRNMLLSVFGSNFVTVSAYTAIGVTGSQPSIGVICWMLLYFGLILAAAFAPGRRLTIGAIVLILAMYVASFLMS